MEDLQNAVIEVKKQLRKDRYGCGADIFVVLSSCSAKNSVTCGQHLINVISSLQKAAGAIKRSGSPNLILAQSHEEIPANVSKVELNGDFFNQPFSMDTYKFEGPSLQEPFMVANGKLVNLFGPVKQYFKLDPGNHGNVHNHLEAAVRDFAQENSKKSFSIFQILVKGVIYSKYCDKCLSSIFNNLKSWENVSHFVSNLNEGVRSPISEGEMGVDWYDDEGEKYENGCWRFAVVQEESRDIDDLNTDKTDRYNPEDSSFDTSTGHNLSDEKIEEPTKSDMYEAYLSIEKALIKHKTKLPVKSWCEPNFCVFCFKFHSSSDHECEYLEEAQKRASKKLYELVEGKFTIDSELHEKMKKFVDKQICHFDEEGKRRSRVAVRTGVPIKPKEPSKKKNSVEQPPKMVQPVTESPPAPKPVIDVSKRLALRTGVPVTPKVQPVKKKRSVTALRTPKREQSQTATATPSDIKNLEESPSKRSKTDENTTTSSSEMSLKEATQHTVDQKIEQPESPPRASNYREGYVPPHLPTDRALWTRDQYNLNLYGPSYRAIHQLNPHYPQFNFQPNNGYMVGYHGPFNFPSSSNQQGAAPPVVTLDDDDDNPIVLN